MSIELPPGALKTDWKRELKANWLNLSGGVVAGAAGGSELGNINVNLFLGVKTPPESHLILISLLILGGSAAIFGLREYLPKGKQLKLPLK